MLPRPSAGCPDLADTEWLQYTHSPPAVIDIDGDGFTEVMAFGGLAFCSCLVGLGTR